MSVYNCAECGSPAKKPPVRVSQDAKTSGSLGTWRCTGGCKGKTKVKRVKE